MSSQAVMKRQILALAKREPSNEELQKIKQSLAVYKKLTKEEQAKINEMVTNAHAKLDSEGKFAKGGKTKTQSMKTALTEFKNKIGAKKFKRATTGTDIKKDIGIPAQKVGKRIVRKKGKTTNQYGTFKNQVGTTYYEGRPNRSDVNQPSEKRKIKLADGGTTKSLASIKRKYLKNEDENAHSENVVLLAKHFGDAEDLKLAKQILAKHNKEGHLSSENAKERNDLHFKLIEKARTKFGEEGIEFAKGGEVSKWSVSDISDAKYLGVIEFQDNQEEYHNFEIMETEDRLVFGSFTNSGFIESGYIEKDGMSTDETLQNLLEDLEVYYNDGEQYTSMIVVNQRMANGGKLRSKAKYIPNRNIDEIEVTRNGKTTSIDGANLLDGVYVKKGTKFADGGRVKVGVFDENQLKNKEDKKAVQKAQKETGLNYVDSKIIKKGGKMFLEVYLIPNEEYYNSNKFAKGGKLSKEDALQKAIDMGVDFDKDFHAQSVGNDLAELAKESGYKKSASSSGSTGRAFFYHLQKIYDKRKYAQGGKLSSKAKYIPKRDIAEIEVEKNGKSKSIDGANLLDGVYVKKGVKFADGGMMNANKHFQLRGLEFLKDDLAQLQQAVEDNNQEEIQKFFSYWGQHLEMLKTTNNERMFSFLQDDLMKLENDIQENNKEEIEKFFSYWEYHLESLKYAKGGTIKKSLAEFKNKVGASKYREATRGVDIKADLQIPALKKGRRVVTTKGKTSNQYGTFKNQVGSVYYENRPNHYDVNQPSEKRKIKLADGGLVGTETSLRFYGENLKYIQHNGKIFKPIYFYQNLADAKKYMADELKSINRVSEHIILPYENQIAKCYVIYKEVNEYAKGGMLDKYEFIDSLTDIYKVRSKWFAWGKRYGVETKGVGYTKKEALENLDLHLSYVTSKDEYAQGGTFANGGALEGAKIYVADLAEYNDGRLVGKWFDLSDYSDASELMGAIQEMLDEQTAKDKSGEVHEEWAVHDFEGFPRSFYSEYMGEKDFEKLYQIADVANERGIPIDVLMEAVAHFGADEDQIEEIADGYYGSVSTNFGNEFKDFAYEYIDSIGSIADAVSNPDFYFDFESFGSDARMDYTDEELEEYGYDELDDTELGERLVDEMGGVDQLGQKTIEMYFDYDKFGRDLEHDFISVKGDDGDYYFFNRNW